MTVCEIENKQQCKEKYLEFILLRLCEAFTNSRNLNSQLSGSTNIDSMILPAEEDLKVQTHIPTVPRPWYTCILSKTPPQLEQYGNPKSVCCFGVLVASHYLSEHPQPAVSRDRISLYENGASSKRRQSSFTPPPETNSRPTVLTTSFPGGLPLRRLRTLFA
jgi:hypothetical protein